MKKTFLALALAGAATGAFAADGTRIGIGADYSRGTYGTDVTTEILSVPLTLGYTASNWTLQASVPWLRIKGDTSVVPGLGGVIGGRPGTGAATGTTTTSGVGDLRLSATYSIPFDSGFGIDLTGSAKIATADEDKGLGTGANDYGVGIDLYRSFETVTLFGGAGYTSLGESPLIDAEQVANANAGLRISTGAGDIGAVYEWRESPSTFFDDRSDLSAFYGRQMSDASRMQLYVTKGLSDGSPDWGAGVSFTSSF